MSKSCALTSRLDDQTMRDVVTGAGRAFPAVLLVAWVIASPARAQDAQSRVRAELDARYTELARAHDRKDLAAIVAMKTVDFHSIFPDGNVGDARVMEEYSRRFLESNQPPYDIRVKIVRLTVSPNELIAVAEVLQEASRFRELAGKRRKVETSVLQRETWSKIGGEWKLKSVDSVRDQKRFVDGKRVDPTAPYDPNAPPFNPDTTRTPRN
ncbi:MAG: hypothetical protein ACJ78D_14410 [Gemmatimonadaceae bacterium]